MGEVGGRRGKLLLLSLALDSSRFCLYTFTNNDNSTKSPPRYFQYSTITLYI
jgi:hypothetical protein